MKRTWTMLVPYLRRHRRALVLAAAGTVAFNALALLPPLIFRYLIDHVVEPGKRVLHLARAHVLKWVNATCGSISSTILPPEKTRTKLSVADIAMAQARVRAVTAAAAT